MGNNNIPTINNEVQILKKDTLFIPLCDFAGYAALVAWAFMVLWSRNIMPANDAVSYFTLRCVYYGSVALMAALMAFVATKPLFVFEKLGTILCTMFAISFFVELPSYAIYLLWAFSGIGQQMMFSVWYQRLVVLTDRQRFTCIIGSFVIGGLALCLSQFADELILLAVTALLPVISFVFLVFARRQFDGLPLFETIENDSDASSRQTMSAYLESNANKFDRSASLPWFVFSLIYSFPFGFFVCSIMLDRFCSISGFVLGFANAALALVLVLLRKKCWKWSLSILPRIYLTIAGSSYLVFCAFWPSPLAFVGIFAIVIVSGCFEIVGLQSAIPDTSSNGKPISTMRYAFSRMGNSLGTFLGFLLFVLVFLHDEENKTALLFTFLFVITASNAAWFFLAGNFASRQMSFDLFSEGAVDRFKEEFIHSGSDQQKKGHWICACESLAAEYRLSPRQTEIFILLAKGRNTQFIKDDLVLSSTTVKSHIYNIYQKMGIHSQQELLDMVEQCAKKTSNGSMD